MLLKPPDNFLFSDGYFSGRLYWEDTSLRNFWEALQKWFSEASWSFFRTL